MQFREVASQDRPAVLLMRDGRLRVGPKTYPGAVLLLGGDAREWAPCSAAGIDPLSLRPVMDSVPAVDLLLIGTGPVRVRITPEVESVLDAAGIAHEAMATASAVRALNALAGDAREIAFAALPG